MKNLTLNFQVLKNECFHFIKNKQEIQTFKILKKA